MGQLLGRSAELDAVVELLARPIGTVVVHGEAGVGKSALVARALHGVAHRAGGALGTLSWLPFVPLRRAFPELPGDVWTGDADYVAAAVEAALRSDLLLVEDLHWADAGSLAVVEQLIGRVRLVATVRRGDPAAADTLARLEKVGAARLDLEPLDRETAASLVSRVRTGLPPARIEDLVERSGGNPLLIEELAGGSGSESLELAMLARCRQLSEAQLDGLAMLALAGRPLPADVLPDPVGLVDSGLVVVVADGARIRHAMLAEVIGDLLSPDRRTRCHRALADLLDHPGDVARHLLAAGDRAGAHAAALRAVEQAATPGERWRHLATAAESATGEEAVQLRLRASEAACTAAEPERARQLLAGLGTRGPHAAGIALARATQAFQSGEWDRYAEEVAAGKVVARPGSAEEALLRAREATAALIIDNDAQRSLDLAREAIALAERAGISTASAKGMAASALSTMQQPGWQELFHEAIAEARAEGDPYRELNCRHNYVIALTGAGDLGEALAEATRQQQRCHDLRLLKKAHSAEVASLVVARYRGDVGHVERQAAHLLGEALSRADRLDVVSILALVLAEQGRTEAALAEAEHMREWPSHRSNYHASRACAFGSGGHPERALEEWALFEDSSGCDAYAVTEFAPAAAWAAWELGRPLPDRPGTMVGGLFAGAEPELDGIHALAAGRFAEARQHFERAVLAHGERRGPVLTCRWASAEAARLAGEPQVEVEAMLRAVRADASGAGFVPVATRCERSLRAMGVRAVGSREVMTDSVLSVREQEVVDLVVEGLTDRNIAARLGLAHRTVQTHVASARRKLGADSRSHLAALAGAR